jgi:hypothetical protein
VAIRVLLAFALWLLGGCTAILAARGDPDMSLLQVGAERTAIDAEMGKPDSVTATNTGSLVVYLIKLGAPKDKRGLGKSLTFAGAGAAAGVGVGIIAGLSVHVVTLGFASGTPHGASVGLVVGGSVWLVCEIFGTVGQLARLSNANPYRLEVSYDKDSRLVTHKLHEIGDGD